MKSTCRQLGFVLLFAVSGLIARAQVYADLTFSGGSGAPLSITLNTPLHFELSGPISNPDNLLLSIPIIAFRGVGIVESDDGFTGSIPLSLNGTTVMPFPPGTFDDTFGVDLAVYWSVPFFSRFGVVADDDLLLSSDYFLLSTTPMGSFPDLLTSYGQPDLFSGGYFDVGTGTLTSSGPYDPAPPADGHYEVYVANSNSEEFTGITVSVGAPVPEPSAYAALAGLAALGAALVMRRRNRA